MDEKPSPDLLLLERCYEWNLWLFQKTTRFPKHFRSSLTQRIEAQALDLLGGVNRARFLRERRREIQMADEALDQLRILMRLAHQLGALSTSAYEEGAARLSELGRMLGGWKKSSVGS